MSDDDDRLAELLGAASADELTSAEREELLDVLRHDPEAAAHLGDHQDVVAALRSSDLTWQDAGVSRGLRARVLSQTVGADLRRRLPVLLAAAAAAVVLAGFGGYVLGTQDAGPDDPVVAGGPGTLGAIEPVTFAEVPEGVDVDASLVAHTWGTETVLDVSGLRTGERYRVELAETDGDVLTTGSFIAAADVTDCRMNGAVPRADVEAVRVLDASGTTVLTADLPRVS
ncbi:MAG: hypothetical protein Q7T56_19125 [Nocardioidaceae bacterium]|nr:hypothetical protein [Nocardioidaceae bacterium]